MYLFFKWNRMLKYLEKYNCSLDDSFFTIFHSSSSLKITFNIDQKQYVPIRLEDYFVRLIFNVEKKETNR